MNYILFFFDVLLLFSSSYFFLFYSKLRKDRSEFLLAIFVLLCGQIIGGTLLLSELRLIVPGGYIAIHICLFLISAALAYRKKISGKYKVFEREHSLTQEIYIIFNEKKDPPSNLSVMDTVRSIFSRDNAFITSFTVLIIITLLLEICVASLLIPRNYDSMVYHLSRVGYWAQFKTLRHFFTTNLRQTLYSVNGEVLLLWPYTFLKSDTAFSLLQWICMLFTSVLVYKASRLIRLSKKQSLFSSFLFITLPLIVIESTTTQNDIVLTFFIFSTICFLMIGLRKSCDDHILISAVSLGIVSGIKATFFLAVPGIVVVLVYYYLSGEKTSDFLHYKKDKELLKKWIKYSLLFILLLGVYNYVLNFIGVGNALGGKSDFAISDYSLEAFLTNLVRIMYRFIDFSGIPSKLIPSPLLSYISKIFKALFELFGIDYNLNSATICGVFSFTVNTRSCDSSYFGPLGFLIILPVFFFSTFRLFIKKRRDNLFKTCLIIMAGSVLISYCTLLKYNSWVGRFFIMFVAFVSPLCGVFYSRKKVNVKMKLIFLICLNTAITCQVYNLLKPLPESFVNMKQRTNSSNFYYLKYIEDNIEPDKNIGIVITGNMWDFPLFNGKRKVFQMRSIKDIPPGESLDYILIDSEILDYKNLPDIWAYTDIDEDWAILTYLGKNINKDSTTELMKSARKGEEGLLQALLSAGMDVNKRNNNGLTALIFASDAGKADVVQVLLDRGADANIKDKRGWSALMYAVEEKHVDVVELLLNNGADPNTANVMGETPIMKATSKRVKSIVEMLIKSGANVNAKSRGGRQAILNVSHNGYSDIRFLLKRAGANVW